MGEIRIEMNAASAGGIDPADEGREPGAVPGRGTELAEAAIIDRYQNGRCAGRVAAELVAACLKNILERLADLGDAEDEPDQQRQQQGFPAESIGGEDFLHLKLVSRESRS